MAGRFGGSKHRLKGKSMNTLGIWNPIHEMDALFHNRLASVLSGEGQQSVAWSPVVDIEETETHYVIRAELPGLSKDKVKVKVVLKMKRDIHLVSLIHLILMKVLK